MSDLKAIAWKEWHEVRAFLWIGLGVFLGLPVIGGLESLLQNTGRFELRATPWILGFGGVLAVFVAVGATTRDFNGRLEDFWRSRPVGVSRWMFVKYVLGLLVVQLACVLPLLLELPFNREKDAMVYVAWLPFMWTAIYTLAFLVGVVVRRMAHAAMLGLGALLLVYFLPLVLPPLEWMNVARITATAGLLTQEQFEFAGGMLAVAGVALVLALLAARFDWRIDSGAKMLYGSVSAALLILFSSVAFQMGTNLPVLQEIDLPKGERVQAIQFDGSQGYLETRQLSHSSEHSLTLGTFIDRQDHFDDFTRTIELTPSGIKLGDPVKVPIHSRWDPYITSPSDHPEIHYEVFPRNEGGAFHLVLYAIVSGQDVRQKIASLEEPEPARWAWPALRVWQNRLYVMGSRLVTLDITEPLKPRIISDMPFQYQFLEEIPSWDKLTLDLPNLPGVPPRERLETALRGYWVGHLEGDILCKISGNNLIAYRLTSLTDKVASFEKTGQYAPTILATFFGFGSYGDFSLKNGLVYMSESSYRGLINPHVDVFDARGAGEIRPIGHFAAPGVEVVCPLPDGRALVGGTKLWLVGPPPRRG